MIIGTRSFESHLFHGVQIFIQKSWNSPLSQMGEYFFQGFDKALEKQLFDPDSTGAVSTHILGSPFFSKLDNAEKTGLRNIPESHRNQCQIYTFAWANSILYFRMPPWMTLLIESSNGELFSLNSSKSWQELQLESTDIGLHLQLKDFSLVSTFKRVPGFAQSSVVNYHRFSSLLTQAPKGRIINSACFSNFR